MDKAQQDALKKAAGIEAAKLIQNGMIAGLGTASWSTSSAAACRRKAWSSPA